jgi:endonuclease/exonuclease/phosphatase family metal-dependent hydrolase
MRKIREIINKESLKKILHRTFLVINILFASALLLAYLAIKINPEDFAFPAFFGLAYPYILLINFIIVIIWGLSLRYEALISVFVIALGFNHISNYIRFVKPSDNNQGTFNVMSYNLRLFNYFEKPKRKDYEKKILEYLKTIHPDILCFQELFIIGNPNEKDQEIRNFLGGKYYSHTKLLGRRNNQFYGIATYSRYPIIKKGEILHPGSASLSIYSDIVIENDTFRIFNNHLQSFRLRSMERSLIEELTLSEDNEALGEIRSLSLSLKHGFVRRALQAQVVKNYINISPYPVIVLGDFNDTPVSYAYRKIRKGLNDAFVNSGYGAGFTYRGNYPPNRIDYILYDNKLKSTKFDILKVKFSDHYPIVASFRKQN